MSDVSTTRVQALLLAREIEVWLGSVATSGRSYTEQGPRPGLALADRDSDLVVVPGGPC